MSTIELRDGPPQPKFYALFTLEDIERDRADHAARRMRRRAEEQHRKAHNRAAGW